MIDTFALVEIHRQCDGALPAAVIELAYKASRRARIALVLHGVSPAEVDRLLDPLVARCRLDIPGLIYLHEGEVARETAHRLDHANAGATIDVLARLARDTRLEEMAAS